MNIGESFTPAVRAQEVLTESSKAYGITAPVSALIVGQVLLAPHSSRSLASGIFSRSDSKTQTQNLTKSTPPYEFKFQLNIAVLVDFLKSHIKRPLFEVRPKLKRRVLNNSA
jgi:hypothetical protein